MNTTMNTGAASLSDEQLDDILNEHWNYQGVPRVSHIIDAMRAAISVALSIATPQADAAPLVDGLPPLPAPLEIEWPELHSQALGCGVEDRGIHDRYEAAEYGWQDGVDRAAERVPEEIFTADQMREYARAAIAAGGAQEAVECRVCNGHGYRTAMSATGEGAFNETCVYCRGTGKAAHLANEASKPAAQQTLSDGAQFFACYLIDNCENEVVREESVQAWLGKMLASPRYHPAAPSVEQDERGAVEWMRDICIETLGILGEPDCIPEELPVVARRIMARAASTSANVAQYRNEALSALLVDHSHAASAKDVDAVLKARDAIYSMFANVAQGAEAQSGTHEAWTYEQVVQLCEIDGVDLPIEYVEWVAEKMTRAANDVLQSISEMSPAGLTEREQFIWNLGHAAALEKPASGNQEPVGLVLTNDKGEKYGALLDSNIEERTRLYAAPPAQTATTDAARECLADVVSHYRALYAGLAFQLNEATVSENSDDMTYWKHEIEALERMYEQAERALTAAQSASASEGK